MMDKDFIIKILAIAVPTIALIWTIFVFFRNRARKINFFLDCKVLCSDISPDGMGLKCTTENLTFLITNSGDTTINICEVYGRRYNRIDGKNIFSDFELPRKFKSTYKLEPKEQIKCPLELSDIIGNKNLPSVGKVGLILTDTLGKKYQSNRFIYFDNHNYRATRLQAKLSAATSFTNRKLLSKFMYVKDDHIPLNEKIRK